MAVNKRLTTAMPTEREALMDISAVAVRLGVTVRHVRRLVAERRIPYVKWRHLLRFDPAEIEAWLEAARVPVDDTTLPVKGVRAPSWDPRARRRPYGARHVPVE